MTQENLSRRAFLALAATISVGTALASMGLEEPPLKEGGTNHWHGLTARWGKTIGNNNSNYYETSGNIPLASPSNAKEIRGKIRIASTTPPGLQQAIIPVLRIRYSDCSLFTMCTEKTLDNECWLFPYLYPNDPVSKIAVKQEDGQIQPSRLTLYYLNMLGNELPGSFSVCYEEPKSPYNLQALIASGCSSGTVIEAECRNIYFSLATEYKNPLNGPVVFGNLLFEEYLRSNQIEDKSKVPQDVLSNALKVINYQLAGLKSIRSYPVYYGEDGRISVRPDDPLRRLAA